MTTIHVPVTVLVTDEATVAETEFVQYPDAEHDLTPYRATGYAKKHPLDAPNAETAYNLAVARALSELSDEYARRAATAVNGTVEVGGYHFTVPTPPKATTHYLYDGGAFVVDADTAAYWQNVWAGYTAKDVALSLKHLSASYE